MRTMMLGSISVQLCAIQRSFAMWKSMGAAAMIHSNKNLLRIRSIIMPPIQCASQSSYSEGPPKAETSKQQEKLNFNLNNAKNNDDEPYIRIYTRTGDRGTSALFSGERRSKSAPIFEALGSTDELSCAIGFAREHVEDLLTPMKNECDNEKDYQLIKQLNGELQHIQCVLQDLQSAVATPLKSARETQLHRVRWDENHLNDIESWTDSHGRRLPSLTKFILPSGGKAATALHMARAAARRAERHVVPILESGDVEQGVIKYLNRLSSYLFNAARLTASLEGHKEKIYIRPQSGEGASKSQNPK